MLRLDCFWGRLYRLYPRPRVAANVNPLFDLTSRTGRGYRRYRRPKSPSRAPLGDIQLSRKIVEELRARDSWVLISTYDIYLNILLHEVQNEHSNYKTQRRPPTDYPSR
jgi:hypothetical protein